MCHVLINNIKTRTCPKLCSPKYTATLVSVHKGQFKLPGVYSSIYQIKQATVYAAFNSSAQCTRIIKRILYGPLLKVLASTKLTLVLDIYIRAS